MSPVPAARTSKRAAVSTAVASPESQRDLRPIRSGIEIEPWSEDGEATLVRGPTGPRTAAAGFSVLYRGGVRARRHPLGLESPARVAAHGAHELFRNRAIGSRRGIGRRLDRQNERRKGNARQPDGSQSIPLRRGPQEPRDDQKQCRRHPDDIGKVRQKALEIPGVEARNGVAQFDGKKRVPLPHELGLIGEQHGWRLDPANRQRRLVRQSRQDDRPHVPFNRFDRWSFSQMPAGIIHSHIADQANRPAGPLPPYEFSSIEFGMIREP